MKTDILLSIVIPVYRVEKYLARCIDTLIAQLESGVELVLVDDGSDDACPSICDEYSRKYSCIKTVHKANGGLVSAWMAGVEVSKGEYLVFVDSDDWVDLNMIEELVKHTGACKREIICSNYIIEKENKMKNHNDIIE